MYDFVGGNVRLVEGRLRDEVGELSGGGVGMAVGVSRAVMEVESLDSVCLCWNLVGGLCFPQGRTGDLA